MRIVRAGRIGHRVHLVHRVLHAVHHHVEAGVEEVLVDGPVDPGRHQLAPRGLHPGRLRPVRDDAGHLHLELDGPVLVEAPVEPVLVVAHGGDERHDEAAGTAHLGVVGTAPVDVLPEDPVVLLVDAHGIGQGHRAAPAIVDHGVEIADLPEAVAPVLEGVGEGADAVLPHVEGVAVKVGRPRVAVGHHHVGDGGAVEDGPLPSLVRVGHGVNDQPLARREAQAHPPLLPGELVATQLEARALGLPDLDRLEIRPARPSRPGNSWRPPAAGPRRRRPRPSTTCIAFRSTTVRRLATGRA